MATELTIFLEINTNIDFLLMNVVFVLARYSPNKTILGINLKAVQLLVVYRNYFPIQKSFVCCYHGLWKAFSRLRQTEISGVSWKTWSSRFYYVHFIRICPLITINWLEMRRKLCHNHLQWPLKLVVLILGSYAGFDTEQPTSAAGGKPKVAQLLKDTKGYKNLVFIGDGATDAEASPPAVSICLYESKASK